MAGDTYAPMDRMAELVPPGAPTVDRAGPALPALLTNMTPCLCTACNQERVDFFWAKQTLLVVLVDADMFRLSGVYSAKHRFLVVLVDIDMSKSAQIMPERFFATTVKASSEWSSWC